MVQVGLYYCSCTKNEKSKLPTVGDAKIYLLPKFALQIFQLEPYNYNYNYTTNKHTDTMTSKLKQKRGVDTPVQIKREPSDDDASSSDPDYTSPPPASDSDAEEEPDLQTDALLIIEKVIAEQAPGLTDEERARLEKELKRIAVRDGVDAVAELAGPDPEAEAATEDQAEEEEEGEDVPLSEAEFDDDADLVPFQKLTVYNQPALAQALSSIRLVTTTEGEGEMEFVEHLSLSTAKPVQMRDVFDDLKREEAFELQAKECVERGFANLESAGVVFRVPEGYSGAMVRDQTTEQAQQEQVKEPQQKRDRTLKRKRAGAGRKEEEAFRVMQEEAEAQMNELEEKRGGAGAGGARAGAGAGKWQPGRKNVAVSKGKSQGQGQGQGKGKDQGQAKKIRRLGKSKRANRF